MRRRRVTQALVLATISAACGTSGSGPGVGDACDDAGVWWDRFCTGSGDEIVYCDAASKRYAKHVDDSNGITCTCPDGSGFRRANCQYAGFVGVARGGRERRVAGRRLRRVA